ncbi:flagellar filament capping protein FliD [Pseudodesulfovibrio thermohalotolerans]|uniref:flagellar filament capping protein FliD n=1 Tax=Pseudodesulfovibrio thermohalotolerans TaxID=2880651 RepID=UPI0024430039|nr:flagellar filament capping protein FliD [Pseudodesulfovibrio thermohalotolerans]WFS63736.1 flagellar filament capping protein FliD [Pseudodesulfovibrio thermohalotolerans]
MADSTYTSGSINFTGLGNGTDFNSLIDGLVDVERTRITRLENWKATWETKNEQFQELNTQLLSLKTTLEGMDTLNEFISKGVASSNTNLLTATADAEALESTHTVVINQLATNDILITTSGANSLDTVIASSDTAFTFSYGGESYTIDDIPAGTTLEGFVNLINNHPDSRGLIQATTIFDGSAYHLQLSGKGLGADNQLVISNAGSLTFGAGSFTETQNAQNSQIRVDGFPTSNAGWIERDSNTIDDIISGITLDLKEAAPNSVVSLTVNTDINSIAQNVTNFVDSVNTIRAQIIALTKVDETKGGTSTGGNSLTDTTETKGSILTGNYGIDIISQNLKNITANIGLGFSPWDEDTLSGDKYSAMSQLGIMTDAEQGSATYGLLTIDYEKLEEALESDPTAVAELFSLEPTGVSRTTDFTFTSLIDGTTMPGDYNIEIVSDGSQIVSATINGEEASVSGWEITGLTGSAKGMALRLNNTEAGTYSGKVAVKAGKATEMINELTQLTKPYNKFTYEGGPLAVLQNNYNDIMDSIDDKIAYEETRIEKLERNLRLKYARLDSLLGQYELQQGQLEAALAQLE